MNFATFVRRSGRHAIVLLQTKTLFGPVQPQKQTKRLQLMFHRFIGIIGNSATEPMVI
jgi:hypothetical protein